MIVNSQLEPAYFKLEKVAIPLLVIWAISCGLSFFSEPLTGGVLDFFHEAESLWPAVNFVNGKGIWLGSYLTQGAFYGPFTALLGWEVLGVRNLAAFAMTWRLLDLVTEMSLGFFLFGVFRSLKNEKYSGVLLILLVSAVALLDSRYYVIERREAPVFLGLGLLLLGIQVRSTFFALAAGLLSPVCFFYSIDSGAYYLVITSASLASWSWYGRRMTHQDPRPIKPLWSWFSGLILGFLLFYFLVGHDEFCAFVSNTLRNYLIKDYVDGLVYPTPTFQNLRPYGIFMVLIAAQLLGLVALFKPIYLKAFRPELFMVQMLLLFSSICYYRKALSRADSEHVLYSSLFPILGAFFLLWLIVKTYAKSSQVKFFLPAIQMLILLTLIFSFQSFSVGQVLSFPDRKQAFLKSPDLEFFAPQYKTLVDWLTPLVKNQSCFLTTTGEGDLGYFLNKPSCSKYFSLFGTAPKSARLEMLEEIKVAKPKYILIDSPEWTNNIDGLENSVRLPELFDWIRKNYVPFESKGGWRLVQLSPKFLDQE